VKRIHLFDRLLLAVLAPLFVVFFFLSVRETVQGTLAWVPVQVTASGGDALPRISAFWPGYEASGLRLGEAVEQVGDFALPGVGPTGFTLRALASGVDGLAVPVVVAGSDGSRAARLELLAVANAWRVPTLALGIFVMGVLFIFGRPASESARAAFHCHAAYAFHWLLFPGTSLFQTRLWAIDFVVTSALIFPLILRALARLPDASAAGRGFVARAGPWIFALLLVPSTSWVFGYPFAASTGAWLTLAINALFLLTCFCLLVVRYRSADPAGRRRLRWVLWGFYVGTAPIFASATIASFMPELWWLHEITMIAPLAIPVALFLAIVREHLFDIDRIIGATASYSVVSLIVVVGMLVSLPTLTPFLANAFALELGVVQIALASVIAAAVLPLQPRLRRLIDRRFFPERHLLEGGTQDLLSELVGADSADAAFTLVGERLVGLLAPFSCTILAMGDEGLAPIFVRGPAGASLVSFDALAHAFAGSSTPQGFGWKGGFIASPDLPAREREALEALAAEVAIPIQRSGKLTAVVVLGEKRSRDLYTRSDLALIAAVATTLSTVLVRFDEATLLEEMRTLQASLRRYVPGAVATAIEKGVDLEPRKVEVAVLFVDLRGYTALSEPERAETVFAAIDMFTETVSSIISAHGGQVVEFGGDGMMALFGAPHPLEAKERSAVAAGEAIVREVRQIRLGDRGQALDPGIGIATGEAIVGNIHSADRMIWSAIGNVVNLAARLEAATRTLDASIVIDAVTHGRLGDSPLVFEQRPPIVVKGRSDRQEVFVRKR
jgi:class 3 adenylate cyclase